MALKCRIHQKKRWSSFCFFMALMLSLAMLAGCSGGSKSDSNTNTNDDDNNSNDPVYQWNPADFAHVYDVGPGKTYTDPSQVPWESLTADTLVRIYYRDTPYRTKWILNVTATADAPLVVLGIADNGRRPVITGENAVTRTELDYWNEVRSVVKVGGSNVPDNPTGPAYIYIQGLDIRSARPGYTFTGHDGSMDSYSENAAAIHVEEGGHIYIHDCIIHDAGNGIFSSNTTYHLNISANYIYDNGIDGSIYEHNSYTESQNIIFEYNHYGPLRTGCLGNNLKDRSSGTVIRYNWIESGNRQLDLVETDYDHIRNDPAYETTFVYGNILIEPDGAGNSQILHYGGDGGDETMYRTGTLYFYNNTVVSTRSGNATLMRLSTNTVHAQVYDNILYASAGGSYMAITSGNGQTVLRGNWLPTGWVETHESGLDPGASVTDNGNVEGSVPGFVNLSSQDFHLTSGAAARNSAAQLPTAVQDYLPERQYVLHQQYEARPTDGNLDIGAFEYAP
jgi:hypothetical protein